MKTGHFCGQPTPDGWTAPLIPEGPYVKIASSAELAIEIDYAGWISDLKSAHAEWTRAMRAFAQSMYGDKMVEAEDHPPPALLAMVGPKPFPLEPVIAASQGNKWILGFSAVDTKGVGAFMPKKNLIEGYDFSDNDGSAPSDTPMADVKDEWAELEEELDPEAVGGKRIPVKHPRRGPKAAEVRG
jgi:hypothetical protein